MINPEHTQNKLFDVIGLQNKIYQTQSNSKWSMGYVVWRLYMAMDYQCCYYLMAVKSYNGIDVALSKNNHQIVTFNIFYEYH